jgi:hypothetical protein
MWAARRRVERTDRAFRSMRRSNGRTWRSANQSDGARSFGRLGFALPGFVPPQYRSLPAVSISRLDGVNVIDRLVRWFPIDCSSDKHPARRRRRRLRRGNPMARPARWSQPLKFADEAHGLITISRVVQASQRRACPQDPMFASFVMQGCTGATGTVSCASTPLTGVPRVGRWPNALAR